MAIDFRALLNTSIADAMSTRAPALPEGRYEATIKDLDLDNPKLVRETKNGNFMLILPLEVDTDLPGKNARMTLFLDIENNQLATGPGQNTALGRLREALGQNNPNAKWNIGHLSGGRITVDVVHRPNEESPEDPWVDVNLARD